MGAPLSVSISEYSTSGTTLSMFSTVTPEEARAWARARGRGLGLAVGARGWGLGSWGLELGLGFRLTVVGGEHGELVDGHVLEHALGIALEALAQLLGLVRVQVDEGRAGARRLALELDRLPWIGWVGWMGWADR